MKNIKLEVEEYLEFDGWLDYYVDVEINTKYDYPKRQSMKKVIQKGSNMKADYVKKDHHRRCDDKCPYYYARILLTGSKGKTVEECMAKFKKRFTDPYAMEAFWNYFEEYRKDRRRRAGHKDTQVKEGVVVKEQFQRKAVLFDESNYSEKYWDNYGLNYVSKEKYDDYIAYKGAYNTYIKELKRYNYLTENGIKNTLRYDKPRLPRNYNVIMAKYPLGIEKIIEGEKIPIPRKSKAFIQYYESKNNRWKGFRRGLTDEEAESWIYAHNREKKKAKRKRKQMARYHKSLNSALYLSEAILKMYSDEDKELAISLRLCSE